MKELKPGDKIKVYTMEFSYGQQEFVTHVEEIIGDKIKYLHPKGKIYFYAHRKQVRLITKKKVKPITRGDLMLAVQRTVSNDVYAFRWSIFIEELERLIGRKIK